MTTRPTLLWRLTLRLVMTAVLGNLLAYGWLVWELLSSSDGLRDKSLIESAHMVAQATRLDPTGKFALALPQTWVDAYANSDGAHGFAVRDRETGAILFGAGADVGPVPKVLEEDEDGSFYQYNPDGPGPVSYFGEAYPFLMGNRRLVVQIVRLSSDYQVLVEAIAADFFEDGAWWVVPFLLSLVLVSVVTVQRTLAPLRDLSRQAESITPGTPNVRLPTADVPGEVLPLVQAMNNALDRLEAGLRLQKDFTADAAHELRTPLAVLTAHIETLPDKAIAAALRQDLDAMTRLVEQLLRVAQAEALVVLPNEHADLAAIARDVAAYLAPMAIRAGRMIEVDAPDMEVTVHGHADALFHATRNLVDNALRHTPPGTTVTLTVTVPPPTLTVRDCGPGIPPDLQETVFQRFWRSDRQTNGAGLGLAIVQKTMQAHGGTVTVATAEGGGATLSLRFPQ